MKPPVVVHHHRARRRTVLFPALIAILSFSIGILVGNLFTTRFPARAIHNGNRDGDSTSHDDAVERRATILAVSTLTTQHWCDFMPGPQTMDTPDFINEKGCVLGEVLPVKPAGAHRARRLPPPDPRRSLKERLYCSDRAGKGKWMKDGTWMWDEAKRCGFRWFTPEEACELLEGHTIFFMGDSTSRRLAMTLKSMLGGLKAASIALGGEDEALIPDLFSRFTDGIARCVPPHANKCGCVRVAGVGKPDQWESLKVVKREMEEMEARDTDESVTETTLPANPEDVPIVHEAESPQDEQAVTWKSFYVPYVTQFAAQLKTWVPMMVDFTNAVPNAQSMIDQVERMTSRQRTIVVANFGSWHLQSPLAPMVVAQGHKDPYNKMGAGRNKPTRVETSYISTDRFKGKLRTAMNKAKQSPRSIWIWRTMAPVNSSAPRFERASGGDVIPIVTKHGHPYIDVDGAIREWNNVSAREAAEAGWLVADVHDAISPGGPSTAQYQPRFDAAGDIHLRDAGRRLLLQVVLNVLHQHVFHLREWVGAKGEVDYRRAWWK